MLIDQYRINSNFYFFFYSYNIQDNLLGSIVSNYSAHSNGSDFIECLKSAYNDIKSVLV